MANNNYYQQNNRHNGSYPGGGRSGIGNAPLNLPDGYLARGYYEDADKKILRVEYIIDYPKEIVGQLKMEKNKNKSSQLRKYYEFVIRIKDRLRQTNASYDEMKSAIASLIPYAEYARTRGKVSDYFRKFISKNVNSIHDEKDFMAFAKHFEAIIANLPKEN